MTNQEINNIAAQLKEWEDIVAEANEWVEHLKDQLKEELTRRNTEEIGTNAVIVRWTTVTTNRLDTGALKKAEPELCAQYTKPTTSRRFSISR